MADLALNLSEDVIGTAAYGDVVLEGGDVRLTSPTQQGSTDQVVQQLNLRLRLFLGEWFLNTSDGTPWLQQVLVKGAQASAIDAAIKNVILGTPGVVALTRYQGLAQTAQRIYRVTFTVVTSTSGTVTSSVPVGI